MNKMSDNELREVVESLINDLIDLSINKHPESFHHLIKTKEKLNKVNTWLKEYADFHGDWRVKFPKFHLSMQVERIKRHNWKYPTTGYEVRATYNEK